MAGEVMRDSTAFFHPGFFFLIVNFIAVVTVDLCILLCFQAERELGFENVVGNKVLAEESDKHQIVSITSGRACINRSGGFRAFTRVIKECLFLIGC